MYRPSWIWGIVCPLESCVRRACELSGVWLLCARRGIFKELTLTLLARENVFAPVMVCESVTPLELEPF